MPSRLARSKIKFWQEYHWAAQKQPLRKRRILNVQTKQLTTGAAVIVGLLLIVVAVIYFITPASGLPGFLPGHEASSLHHTKHGILALALGLCCFIAARFFWGAPTDTTGS